MGIDYEEVGLKSGIEIHQQLDTRKLFCNCPSLLRKDEPDFQVERKLHAVAGEQGKVDVAATYEASRSRDFIYQGYDTNCLVELDEEPPHELNPEALKIALQISLLLNAKIIPITQIMRKTVIDGSNTSGFQRTVMIARDGSVETSSGRVGIESIYLEEDSARPVSKEKGRVVWRLDRLGIPLIEIEYNGALIDLAGFDYDEQVGGGASGKIGISIGDLVLTDATKSITLPIRNKYCAVDENNFISGSILGNWDCWSEEGRITWEPGVNSCGSAGNPEYGKNATGDDVTQYTCEEVVIDEVTYAKLSGFNHTNMAELNEEGPGPEIPEFQSKVIVVVVLLVAAGLILVLMTKKKEEPQQKIKK